MRAVPVVLALGALLWPAVAGADEERRHLDVVVGQTVQAEVGWAMGSTCDDETIVAASMKNRDKDTNLFVVKGLKPGTTLCRAGTYAIENRPTYLFEVTVVAKRS